MILFALVGMCGAGKSAASIYLQQKAFLGVYFGALTLEELKRRGMEATLENEQRIREDLRSTHGMGAFAKLSIKKIKDLGKSTNRLYIDGLYSWSEYLILRQVFGNSIKLIQIYADKEVRYARLAGRERRHLTNEEAEKRDLAEIEHLEKGGPIAFCDHSVTNNGNTGVLHRQLDTLIARYT